MKNTKALFFQTNSNASYFKAYSVVLNVISLARLRKPSYFQADFAKTLYLKTKIFEDIDCKTFIFSLHGVMLPNKLKNLHIFRPSLLQIDFENGHIFRPI